MKLKIMLNNKDKKGKMTIDKLAIMVAMGFETSNKNLELFKFDTNIHFNNLETDMKSVKKDISELKEKVDDMHDTVMSYDKRIEKLEEKI